jgi:hypothetical protein
MRKLENCVGYMVRTEFTTFSVIIELSPLPLIKFAIMLSLISKVMVICLDDRMVNTHNVWVGAKNPKGTRTHLYRQVWLKRPPRSLSPTTSRPSCCGSSLPTPLHGGNGARNTPAPAPTTYNNFAATHPPLFTEAGEPLEADHWLQVMKSKFGLLRCTMVQKTLFTTQQLRSDTSAWWTNYTATRPADYQVSWAEFRDAFHAHYIPTCMMRKKR